MSDNIYEDMSRSSNNTENIYMNAVPKRSRQRMTHNEIQDSSGGHNHGPSKMAVVFLGLLCALLLAVIIGLCIKTEEARQLRLRYNNLTEEKEHLETNLTEGKYQLEILYNDLAGENRQLQLRYTGLTEEKDQLQILYNDLAGGNKQLQLRYTGLTEKKYQLQILYNDLEARIITLNAAKSLLETNISAISGERDELQSRLCKLESPDMKRIKNHAVEVTLDPDTAHPRLDLSTDGKQAKVGQRRPAILKTSKRFWKYTCVLGKEGFSSGKFYYEVQVLGKLNWDLGVARESINRDNFTLSPARGFWTISLRGGNEYKSYGSTTVLSLKEKPQRVGVFVDYQAGLVSFYDADCWSHMHSFRNVTFHEKMYPYFFVGDVSIPMIINPVVKCMSTV